MANLSVQRAVLTGLAPTFVAASAGGDSLPAAGAASFIVKNGSASAVTVTIATPGKTEFGLDQPDLTISVPAGGERHIGPLTHKLANPETGVIDVTYSAVASVTVAVIAA